MSVEEKVQTILSKLCEQPDLAYEVMRGLQGLVFLTDWYASGNSFVRRSASTEAAVVLVHEKHLTGEFAAVWFHWGGEKGPPFTGISSEEVRMKVDRWLEEAGFLTLRAPGYTPHPKATRSWDKSQKSLYSLAGVLLASIKDHPRGYAWYVWGEDAATHTGIAEHKDRDLALNNACVMCESILRNEGWDIREPLGSAP